MADGFNANKSYRCLSSSFRSPGINKPLVAEVDCPHTTCFVSWQLIREMCAKVYQDVLPGTNYILHFGYSVLYIHCLLFFLYLLFSFQHDVFSKAVWHAIFSLLAIKDRRDAYEITSQSVRLCAPTITFEPVSRLYQLQQGDHAIKFDLDTILLIS
jgi:hypothetical protein